MKPMKLRLSALSMLTAAALAFSPMIPQAVPDTPATSTASSFQSQDEAITPAQYQSMLGHGMDVDWSKTSEGRANYQTQAVIDFVEAGIKHVRIRVKDDLTPDVLASLDRQIDDCLSHGLIPVLA